MKVTQERFSGVRTIREFTWDELRGILIRHLNLEYAPDTEVRIELSMPPLHAIRLDSSDVVAGIRVVHDDFSDNAPRPKEMAARRRWQRIMGGDKWESYSSINLSEDEVYDFLAKNGWRWNSHLQTWVGPKPNESNTARSHKLERDA
jgi:hypothetical protein